MSTRGLAVPYPSRPEQPSSQADHPLRNLIERFTPSQGWLSFGLLVAILIVVGSSVTSADWVETPGLLAVIFLGATTALLLAKVRAPAPLLHLAGLGMGFVIVVWQTSSLVEDQNTLAGQVRELWNRLSLWYDAASSGGISTDLIPFSMAVITAGWLLGYLSAWFLFRSNNVWVALVLSGIALLTNLSFLPDKFASRFFVFMFLAMLLVVRISTIQTQELWDKARLQFSQTSGWLTIHAVVWFSVVVLLLAAVLPLISAKSSAMADLWTAGRTPVQSLEDEFARLFAAIPSRKNLSGRFFGDTLPFLGKVSFDGEVVAWADTEYPSYWLSQTYSEYTAKGWIAGPTTGRRAGPDALPPPAGDLLKRIPVNQTLQIGFDTTDGLSGGSVEWISRDSVFETLAPKQFEIVLLDPSNDKVFPQDIQELAAELRVELAAPPTPFLESHISGILPNDLVLISTEADDKSEDPSDLAAITLARKEPTSPEVVSWTLSDQLTADEAYSIVSSVSIATDEDLRQAGTKYSGFTRDHYLQLPPDLPQRVRDLAERLTRGQETPLDKALVIQAFLRGPHFEYSQKIKPPTANADGVDYFLFETREGYSDYFASSMAVLMRAAGVPTRMAAGYAPGEFDDASERRFIRDSDSHGWVQVYFPNYGWIDFEPTPNWPAHQRRLTTDPDLSALAELEGELALLNPLEELIDPFQEAVELEGGEQAASEGSVWDPSRFIVPAAVALGVLAFLSVVWQLLWTRGLAHVTPVERAYTRMSRLGTLAGIGRRPNQTPGEYAATLANAIPRISDAARQVAWAFATDRYGHNDQAEEHEDELEEAWKGMRGSLFLRALGRLVPGGGAGVRR